ncbi:hypothetical protein MXL39_05905 [Enterobacter sichuanensis]|uniref:hypothetical protein n=1 Tax=Enterobacter sichuanensis TaxID=2071710 RepID=UPI0029856775|nr:hypothetical protein [Enterobacter sichuanensis]MEB5959769.1 hypothetical protein [Enterobacter sichuanensis]HAS1065212.1 hypothetical protein [Enterobacter cloacae]
MNIAKSMLKKNKAIIFMFISLILFAGILTYFKFRNLVLIDCDADFVFRAPQNQYLIKGTMTLKMDHSRKGIIRIDGIVEHNNEQALLNRYAIFTYHQLDATSFRMDNLKITKGERDNASDKDFAINFYSLASKTRRILKIYRIENDYIVGNYRSPVFMCLAP